MALIYRAHETLQGPDNSNFIIIYDPGIIFDVLFSSEPAQTMGFMFYFHKLQHEGGYSRSVIYVAGYGFAIFIFDPGDATSNECRKFIKAIYMARVNFLQSCMNARTFCISTW